VNAAGLYICYWSLKDPLCQTQSLAYLRHLAERVGPFALITFEQPRFRLTRTQARAVRRELADIGIHWYPLTYHKRYPLLATGFDCLQGVLTGLWALWHHRPRVVHSRGSIPGAMAMVLRWLCRVEFLYDADSRLSEEYADNGHWSRQSISFRVTALAERWCRRAADRIVVLSERLRDDFIGQFGVRVPIDVIPCCVDTQRFQFDPAARERNRRELGLANEKLFVYVGKLGPRYLVPEVFGLFQSARERIPDARLLVLSGDPPAGFEEIADRSGVAREAFCVKRAGHAEVPGWLSAADAGLALIRPAGCERGSSPIKVGEYLATGLPVLITAGIGDYSELVARRDVGVVLDGQDEATRRDAIRHLLDLWQAGDSLRQRCRAAALDHCDLEHVGWARYREIYGRLLGE
jgi:glycosyltransferase involved in cell wall biosynthesis